MTDEPRKRAMDLVEEGTRERQPVIDEFPIDGDISRDSDPIHGFFGLTYASYLVLHRSLMRPMPIEWQRRMTQLLREMREEYDTEKVPSDFMVRVRGRNGRFVDDPLASYRHISAELIDSVRRHDGDK